MGTFNRIVQAQKYASPARPTFNLGIGGIGLTSSVLQSTVTGGPMNHGYLHARSEVFVDNSFDTVEKRCFFLLCGKLNNEPAIAIEVGINAFDDPRIKKNL
jgi:hypothetical protein